MIPIFLDYETLRVVWWLLLGVLLIGFAVMDGFDLGTGILLPFVAKTDSERRVVVNTVGPVWEGNQVWLITGAGAIFAAWPPLYAVSFSGFYLAMLLLLMALILRPVGFKYRSKLEDTRWRSTWDWALFTGGFVPSLIFGVAVGNALQGVPFSFSAMLNPTYDGTLIGLLNPFALLCGLVSVAMLTMQGGAWLNVKTTGVVAERARRFSIVAAAATIVLFAVGGFWVAALDGYRIVGEIASEGPSNPLVKDAVRESGAWLANYGAMRWTLIAPVLGFAGAAGAAAFALMRQPRLAFVASSLAILGIVATPGLAMFPFILPSSAEPAQSLTVWDSSSSHMTLFVMLLAAVFLMPLILAYTSWVYRVLKGPVTAKSVGEDHSSY